MGCGRGHRGGDAPAKFSASRFLSDIRRYGVTYMNYVGKPLAYILATPERPDDADNPLRGAFGRRATATSTNSSADSPHSSGTASAPPETLSSSRVNQAPRRARWARVSPAWPSTTVARLPSAHRRNSTTTGR